MKPHIGIFPSATQAIAATHALREVGISEEQATLVAPHSSLAEMSALTPPQPEPAGACGAKGGHVTGAIFGFAGGLLSAATFALAIPGIGPLLAVGTLGVGSAVGALAGGALGGAAQDTVTTAVAPQTFLVYEDALRHGRWLLVVQPQTEVLDATMQQIFSAHGAEEFATARERWWHEVYSQANGSPANTSSDSGADEKLFRRGFDTAVAEKMNLKSCEESATTPEQKDPDAHQEAFQRGYQYGKTYCELMLARYRDAEATAAS